MNIRLLLILFLMNIFPSTGIAMQSSLNFSDCLKTKELCFVKLPLEVLAEVMIKFLESDAKFCTILRNIARFREVNKYFYTLFTTVDADFMQKILNTVHVSDWEDKSLQVAMNEFLRDVVLDHDAKLLVILLQFGVSVNARYKQNNTALHYAARDGYTEKVELLLAHGADITIKDKHLDTALHYAAMGGHVKIVNLLLAHGADATIKNKRLDTALHYITDRMRIDPIPQEDYTEIVNLLLAHGADAHALNDVGCPAFKIING